MLAVSNCFLVVICISLLNASIESKKAYNKNDAKNQKEYKLENPEVRKVRSIKDIQPSEKQPKEPTRKETIAETQTTCEVQPQQACPEAIQAPIQHSHVVKIQKVKAIKAMTEYEICKQECRKKRDMQSNREYVDVLREELRLAEQQLQIQKEKEILEQAIANATNAENQSAFAEKVDIL